MKEKKIEIDKLIGSSDKFTPKVCTCIDFSVMDSRNIILSLIYSEGKTEQRAVIERICITEKLLITLEKTIHELNEEIKGKRS